MNFFLIFEKKYRLNNNYLIISNNLSNFNISKNNSGFFTFISYDEFAIYKKKIKSVDYIFFLAGNINLNKNDTYVSLSNTLNFFKKINFKRLIFTSSGAVYNKNNDYANLKIKLEDYFNNNFSKDKILILRLFTFYGPFLCKNYPFAISSFFKNLIINKKFLIQKKNTIRTYMHTDQLIFFIFLILNKRFSGKNTYDIGSIDKLYISNFFSNICSILKKKNIVQVSEKSLTMDIYYPKNNLRYLEKNMPKIEFKSSIKKYYYYLTNYPNC